MLCVCKKRLGTSFLKKTLSFKNFPFFFLLPFLVVGTQIPRLSGEGQRRVHRSQLCLSPLGFWGPNLGYDWLQASHWLPVSNVNLFVTFFKQISNHLVKSESLSVVQASCCRDLAWLMTRFLVTCVAKSIMQDLFQIYVLKNIK